MSTQAIAQPISSHPSRHVDMREDSRSHRSALVTETDRPHGAYGAQSRGEFISVILFGGVLPLFWIANVVIAYITHGR